MILFEVLDRGKDVLKTLIESKIHELFTGWLKCIRYHAKVFSI